MNPSAIQAVIGQPPLAERPPADLSFDRHLTDQMKDVPTIDATLGDPGRLASPGALAGEVMESLRGFMQRADAMSKSGWNKTDGQRQAHGGSSDDHLHAGPAQASLQPALWSGEPAPDGTQPEDYFDDVVRQALDDMSFYVEAEMLSQSASSLGHTANTLTKGQ